MWVLKDQGVGFINLPAAVESINVSPEIIMRMKNTLEVDTTSDSNDSLAKGIALAQYQLALGLDSVGIYVSFSASIESPNLCSFCKVFLTVPLHLRVNPSGMELTSISGLLSRFL